MASMDTPEAAFRPQQQNATTGFEAWSAIVHDAVERIALWLRYSHYVPKGHSKPPQALLWVSLFSPDQPDRHTFSSQSYPLKQSRFGTDRISIETIGKNSEETEAVMGPGYAVGELKTPAGRLRWDLEFRHDFAPFSRSRAARLQSVAISPFGRARGTIRIGQAKGIKIKDARLMYSHFWGPDRVPEMYWAYAPYLQTAGASADAPFGIAAVDALYVKASALTPASCSGTALSATGELLHDHALARSVFGGNKFDFPAQSFRFNFGGRRIELSARLNQSQKTGFIYRGSDGTPHFNVQSDVSALECQTKTEDGKTLKFSTRDFAVVEFQGVKAWPGVMYMDPYD